VRVRVILPIVALLTLRAAVSFAQDEAPPPPAADPKPADPPPAEEKKEREKDLEVRVIGNKADSLQRVPGSGTVINEKDLKRANPVDSAEMLRRVPGVQVRQEFSGGSRIDISIRGLESGRSRRVLMLEDGIPMSLNPYSEPDMNHAPPIERYRSIEVVKGSGNILFGPQTLAGTVNFITIAPPDRQTITADVDGGSYGYVRALASYGDTIGSDGAVRYVTQVSHRRGDGFRDQPFDSTNGLAKILFPTGKDGEGILKLGFQRDDASTDDIGVTRDMFRANPRRPTVSPSGHTILNRYDVSLTHQQRLAEKTKLKTLVYAYTTDRIWRRPDWTRVPIPGVRYIRIVGDVNTPTGATYFTNNNAVLDRDYDVMGIEPRFEHRLKTAFVEHTIDFGARFLREQAHYEQRTGNYPETYSGTLDFEQKRRSYAMAAYVQDRIAFRPDFLVTPGIRIERLSSEAFTLRDSTGDVFQTKSQTSTGIIPGIGMVFGKKTANVFGNMHYGFAPPRITSTVAARGAPTDVKGDRGISYEIGTRGEPLRWLRGEATGFMSNYANQVAANPDPSGEVIQTDIGATNLYGVESGLLFSLSQLLQTQTIMDLGVRYTFARTEFRYGSLAGNVLPYAPQHSLNANFDVEHRTGLGGQLAYAYVGSQFADGQNAVAENVLGTVGLIDERHIVDANVRYRHRPTKITIRLSVKNMFDSTYIIARRPEGIFPGPYRQILLGARWEWEPGVK
jgi:Fe(3+) dicitrate transport protein